jgi:hypothetical protein
MVKGKKKNNNIWQIANVKSFFFFNFPTPRFTVPFYFHILSTENLITYSSLKIWGQASFLSETTAEVIILKAHDQIRSSGIKWINNIAKMI